MVNFPEPVPTISYPTNNWTCSTWRCGCNWENHCPMWMMLNKKSCKVMQLWNTLGKKLPTSMVQTVFFLQVDQQLQWPTGFHGVLSQPLRLKIEVCAGGGEVSAQLLAAIVWNHKSSHNFSSMLANFGKLARCGEVQPALFDKNLWWY